MNTRADLYFLALLRIILAAILLFSYEVREIELFLPPSKDVSVWGSDWLISLVGATSAWIRVATWMLWIGALLSMLGIATRWGLGAIIISSFYLFSLIQYHSYPVHVHHLWWCTVVLWFSPCDQVLSLGRRQPKSYMMAARGVVFTQIIFGCIFFFPGLHKLLSSDWRSGETLMHILRWKQIQYWDQTIWSLDISAWGYAVMAWLIAIAEMSMMVFLYHKMYRVFLLAVLCFHCGTWLLTGIQFSNLWFLYLAFFALIGSKQRSIRLGYDTLRRSLLPLLLCLGIVWAGFLNIQRGFPWVAYPSFSQSIDRYVPLLVIQVVDEAGRETVLSYTKIIRPDNQGWGENWRLAGIGYPINRQHLEAFWWRKQEDLLLTTPASKIKFWRAEIDVHDPQRTPILKRCIHTMMMLD